MSYDWKISEGQSCQENLKAHEFVFRNQEATLLIKARPAKADNDGTGSIIVIYVYHDNLRKCYG
jgi:hypothetical protein